INLRPIVGCFSSYIKSYSRKSWSISFHPCPSCQRIGRRVLSTYNLAFCLKFREGGQNLGALPVRRGQIQAPVPVWRCRLPAARSFTWRQEGAPSRRPAGFPLLYFLNSRHDLFFTQN